MFDHHRRANFRRLIASVAVAAGLVVGSVAGVPQAAAQTNPFERGPNPTLSALQADRGPFAVSETTVSRTAVQGFGGGTIYYPTSTAAGTFGAIAMSPGYTATQSSISWYGPRLASHGFVVFTIDTESRYDQPSSRGSQLLAALDYLTQRSTVRSRIDASRLGVMGHSMGGGGALTASASRPSLQAAIPLTGYHTRKDWSGNRVPTLIIGAQDDRTAPVASHSEPFYESLPTTPDKAYLELAGASHFAPNSPNDTIAVSSIAWLKRFVDNDVRYEQFLCPAPSGSAIEEYRDTCPSTS